PQLEEADRVVFEGVDTERYHERTRREPIDPRQRRVEGRAPRAEISPSRQRQVLVRAHEFAPVQLRTRVAKEVLFRIHRYHAGHRILIVRRLLCGCDAVLQIASYQIPHQTGRWRTWDYNAPGS